MNAHTEEVAREKTTEGREIVDFGLALGGLAGNNAHGAGALQAAIDVGFVPDMISCTSGQIFWVDLFLQVLNDPGKDKEFIKKHLQEHIKQSSPTGIEPLDLWLGIVDTDKDRNIRTAWMELPLLMLRNLCQSYLELIGNFGKFSNPWNLYFQMLSNLFPARILIPQFSDEFFEGISRRFNACESIGILFNSYQIHQGRERVYLNRRAFDLLGFKEPWDLHGVYHRPSRFRTEYCPITPSAVRDALWIYEYGMPNDGGSLDGAYYRQMILDELARARTIIAVRPVNFKWIGAFPHSWIGQQDLKTETNFNGSYVGEREKILVVNELLSKNKIPSEEDEKQGYHEINFKEIEIEFQEGFFDYTRESLKIFERAWRKMLECL